MCVESEWNKMLMFEKGKLEWKVIKSEKIKSTQQDKWMFLFQIDPAPVEKDKKALLLEGCLLPL